MFNPFKRIKEVQETVSSEQYKFAIQRYKFTLVVFYCMFIPALIYCLMKLWWSIFIISIPAVIFTIACVKAMKYCEKEYEKALSRENEILQKEKLLEQLLKEKEQLEEEQADKEEKSQGNERCD